MKAYLYEHPGMDERDYFDLCPSLLPHLKGKPRKESNRYIMKYLLGKPQTDGNVDLIVSDILCRVRGELEIEVWEEYPGTDERVLTKVPTPYGSWKTEVATVMDNLIAKKATRAGRNKIKDAIILFLCYEMAYPEIEIEIFRSFNQGELEMIRRGLTHLTKKYHIKIKDYPSPLLIDKYFFLLFDKERWRNSILDHPVILERCESKEKIDFTKMTTSDFKRRVCATFKRVSETVDNFFNLVDKKHEEIIAKIMKEVKNPRDGIFVVSYIYAINCAEGEMGMKVLKNKTALYNIFGMSKSDFYRKLQFLAP